MAIYTLTREPGGRQWAGGLTMPPRVRDAVPGDMPAPDYPIPTHARRLVEALQGAGEKWELKVLENEDRVTVIHWHPDEDPMHTHWEWQSGRRRTGPAVRDTLTALNDRKPKETR
ncbi:hypothetical protein [Nocardiopsis sp. NPDC058789]|uniref:hypothetical protein n=1 Tax=Nocardiopsis sp. NPDC058789 TaxID=3346634 RepID=UPI00366D596E